MITALEGGEWSASRPGCSLPPGKTRYPLHRRLGGPQGRSRQVRKISPPTGIRSPAALYLREKPGTHCTGSWVGHRAGLDRCGKSRLPPGFDPRTVQPVESLYGIRYPAVARMGKREMYAEFSAENTKNNTWNWVIILSWMLRKWIRGAWTGFVRLRIRISVGLLWR